MEVIQLSKVINHHFSSNSFSRNNQIRHTCSSITSSSNVTWLLPKNPFTNQIWRSVNSKSISTVKRDKLTVPVVKAEIFGQLMSGFEAAWNKLKGEGGRRTSWVSAPPVMDGIMQKINVNSPKGARDFAPEDMRLRNLHFSNFRELYGFEKADFPVFESEALFIRKAGEEIRDQNKAFAVPRRNVAIALILSSYILSDFGLNNNAFGAQPSVGFREYIDTFDGYSFKYPQNWIQVRGAGADIFFRDPFVLDENLSVEFSSPSSSMYKSVEDLGPPQEAGKKVLKQYLTEFMSTRLGVRRESNILSTSSRTADDGKLYYQVEVNIKSYANNNELAVMPQDRIARLEWDRRYLSVLGVENNRLYELRLQTPENVFVEEENDLRQMMDSFRVNKVAG